VHAAPSEFAAQVEILAVGLFEDGAQRYAGLPADGLEGDGLAAFDHGPDGLFRGGGLGLGLGFRGGCQRRGPVGSGGGHGRMRCGLVVRATMTGPAGMLSWGRLGAHSATGRFHDGFIMCFMARCGQPGQAPLFRIRCPLCWSPTVNNPARVYVTCQPHTPGRHGRTGTRCAISRGFLQ
jgi:hypothetical protein